MHSLREVAGHRGIGRGREHLSIFGRGTNGHGVLLIHGITGAGAQADHFERA